MSHLRVFQIPPEITPGQFVPVLYSPFGCPICVQLWQFIHTGRAFLVWRNCYNWCVARVCEDRVKHISELEKVRKRMNKENICLAVLSKQGIGYMRCHIKSELEASELTFRVWYLWWNKMTAVLPEKWVNFSLESCLWSERFCCLDREIIPDRIISALSQCIRPYQQWWGVTW